MAAVEISPAVEYLRLKKSNRPTIDLLPIGYNLNIKQRSLIKSIAACSQIPICLGTKGIIS